MQSLPRHFGFLLKDTSRLYTRRFEERARSFGLTLTQCKALVHLANNEGVSQKRLCELADIEPMAMVRIVDRMAADGWIVREPHPSDRRAHRLRTTPQSQPIQDRIWALADRTRAEFMGDLDAAERKAFLGMLRRIHAAGLSLEPVADEASSPADPDGRRGPSVRRSAAAGS